MNISRELKIGTLALLAIVGMIWGYKFVIGQNLLKPSRTFYVNYKDVTDLAISSPVKLNGFSIGSVVGIKLNKDNVKEMKVTLQVEDEDIKFPVTTKALLANDGLVGGKYVTLEFDKNCDGSNCLEEDGYMIPGVKSLLSTMIPQEELDNTMNTVTRGLTSVFDSLGASGKAGPVNESIRNLEKITNNLAALTASTDQLLRSSQSNLKATLSNINQITAVIAGDRARISGLLSNLDSITGSLVKADLGKTIENSNTAIIETSEAIKAFQNTLQVTDGTMVKFSDLLTKIDSGEGSLSQLLNDQQLYTNLEFTSKNLALLLQDIRLNPKRYISVSVFGKDQKEFVSPDQDPAFKEEWEIRKIKKQK